MKNRKAFTLIEMLVTTLIIGVLIAVAVPAYENAIAKTYAAQVESAIRNIAKAQTSFFLENNMYATDPAVLDITYPISNDGTKITLKKGECNLTHLTGTDPYIECEMTHPHLTFHHIMDSNRLNCHSYSDDDYKADFVCQELTEMETPYKTAGNMRYYSHGITHE